MIQWLARRTWGRIVLVPAVFAACAFSWATYLKDRPADKQVYWRNLWGWNSPEMQPHWDNLSGEHPDGRKSTFHELKNIGAEYCRFWPQTAAKAGSFLASILALAALIGGLSWVFLLH